MAQGKPYQLKREVDLRTILIECLSVGLRVTLMAFRLTVSMVIFQKPLLGTVIFAGKVSNAAVIGVSTAILEAAEVGIAHQANVAGLRALDLDDVVFVEVFALVYKFHLPLRTAGSG